MTSSNSGGAPQQRRNVLLTAGVLFAVVIAIFVGAIVRTITAKPDLTAALEAQNALYFEDPRPVPAVELTDHNGNLVNTAQLDDGHWRLINFGYTFCPDICPTNMADLANAYRGLTEDGLSDRLDVWMITVDPARDSVEQLAQYVPFFHPDFTGLTGDENNAIQPLARQLNTVFYPEGEGDVYTVAHSDNLAVLNPQGDYVALIRPPHSPDQYRQAMRLLMQN
ncbi:SCO family protein [Saccharospirillum mangrovi]|uniref:SCO family protein n=1 Tax=Saccharospirillum mangrovi TaxID=2161747 RepID=UPI000D3A0521|nr:SCO family protein [Saccharospirillum mangrovi]